MKKTIIIIILLQLNSLAAQIPQYRLSHWKKAGIINLKNTSNIIYAEDFGLKGNNSYINDTAILNAINSLGSNGGIIEFNEGTFLFNQPITLKSNITLKGKGNKTILNFNLNHKNLSCINISGKKENDIFPLLATEKKDSILNTAGPHQMKKGDVFQIFHQDSLLAFSSWARGSIGQICYIEDSINLTQIKITTELRQSFIPSNNSRYVKINPIKNVSIQCLKIKRLDSTLGQTSNIEFNFATNCFVKNVHIENCNFGHITFNQSIHNEVSNCYFTKAFAYGGGGQGYGVVLQSTSSENLITNNRFEHLRHSVLLQMGANGNVISYNYSLDPYWESTLTNSAGDMVCHGNYTHHNLFEGNVCQNIVIDNSHGINGPYNTFFRNKAELYGIVVSSNQDSINFIANEITNNTLFIYGQFITPGIGHIAIKNNIKGQLQTGNNTVNEASLYLNNKPSFWSNKNNWPSIGFPVNYNSGTNTAYIIYKDSSNQNNCNYTPNNSIKSINSQNEIIYPNPFNNYIEFKTSISGFAIFSSEGKLIEQSNADTKRINTEKLASGIYYLTINNLVYKVIKVD